MAIRLHLTVMLLFLIIGVFAITIILVPVTNAFSLTHEKPNSNTPFITDNAALLLKQLGLYTLSQHLNATVSNLMGIAEASMNRSNSFGNLPQINLTSEMKIKYH